MSVLIAVSSWEDILTDPATTQFFLTRLRQFQFRRRRSLFGLRKSRWPNFSKDGPAVLSHSGKSRHHARQVDRSCNPWDGMGNIFQFRTTGGNEEQQLKRLAARKDVHTPWRV